MKPIEKKQIETPVLLIDLDVLESNIKIMENYFRNKKAKIRPHYKSHKCPIIAHKQIAAGAKGITCSKIGEAETLLNAGIKDIYIANQIVDPVKIIRLAGLAHSHSDVKISVAVDNPKNVADLSEAAVLFNSKIHVFVEVDVGMGRCGVNSSEETLALAKQITDSPGLVFEGIQAYEGHLVYTTENPGLTDEYRRTGVKKMIKKISKIKLALKKKGINVKEISGGGTGTYNITGNNTIWTEIQAGSYVLMDSVYNRVGLVFKNSLTILSTIMHKRSGIAIADIGLKTCTAEQGTPEIKDHPHLKVYKKLSEEHCLIKDPNDELEYGQKIEFIPSHCCTTVNLYEQFYCIRNGFLEAIWPITGRGKSL